MNQETNKKSFFQKIFLTKDRNGPIEKKMDEETFDISEAPSDSALESLFFSSVPMPNHSVQSFRVFVATWNVGGKSPHSSLNLDNFLQVNNQSDIYVLGHLASGEKEGDELRRNSDVTEIIRNTQFPKICRTPSSRVPEKILDHDRVIWFGDLNYRIALSYSDTRKLLEQNDWDTLLDKDQLKIEKDAGRVFRGWKEGKIYFAPTYKYSYNSDVYAGETIETKNKRRTPAWCDRILWHGNGIQQLSYIRGESRFSDHRPVCATFLVDVEVVEGGLRRKLSGSNMKVGVEELLPFTRK